MKEKRPFGLDGVSLLKSKGSRFLKLKERRLFKSRVFGNTENTLTPALVPLVFFAVAVLVSIFTSWNLLAFKYWIHILALVFVLDFLRFVLLSPKGGKLGLYQNLDGTCRMEYWVDGESRTLVFDSFDYWWAYDWGYGEDDRLSVAGNSGLDAKGTANTYLLYVALRDSKGEVWLLREDCFAWRSLPKGWRSYRQLKFRRRDVLKTSKLTKLVKLLESRVSLAEMPVALLPGGDFKEG